MGVEKHSMLDIANTDLKMSNMALTTTNDELMQNMAAYHTQQAIEKTIKHLLVEKRGFGNNEHDLGVLVADAKNEGIEIPEWVNDNSYEISKWATTIRYNSNFKTNRDNIINYNKQAEEWIQGISNSEDSEEKESDT